MPFEIVRNDITKMAVDASSTKSKEVEPIKWFGFFLWHGYCVPCFTTGKFIEEAAAVMDYRLAALLEKS